MPHPKAGPSPSRATAPDRSQSVDRAVDLLLVVARKGPQRITDLASTLELPRRNVTRLLASLESAGMLRRDARTMEYDLGVTLSVLGALSNERSDLTASAGPALKALASRTQATALLHVRHLDALVAAVVAVPPEAFSVNFPPADRIPLHKGVGRTLLANLSEGAWDDLEIRSPGVRLARNDLRAIREAGFGVSHGEVVSGIHAVGAPVFDANGTPVAVVALAGFSDVSPEASHAVSTANLLTSRIGGRRPSGD